MGITRAQDFFSSARITKFGNGLRSVRRPYVDLTKPTLDGFCEGKDFLQVFRLLSAFRTTDHVENVQSCLARVYAANGFTFGGTYTKSQLPHMDDPLDPKTTMLIWDTGASYGLTPFRSDFIDYVQCDIPVRDVTKVNKVIGIGTTLHKFTDVKGHPVYLPCVSYHLPSTDVRLFSPQTYHQMHGGYSEVYGDCIRMLLKTSTIDIHIVREKHNLPVVFDSFVSTKTKRALATTMRSGLCHARLNILDFFHDNILDTLEVSPRFWHHEPEHYSNFCAPCVGSQANENLSGPQKELLKWHWKLGIGMHRIQILMCERHYHDAEGVTTILPAIIKPKFSTSRNCVVPACQSCLLARARKRSTKVSRMHSLEDKEGILTRDQYETGDFVSTDQFICKTPGRLPTGYGRESQDRRFQGGTIYNDAASGLIWVENQISLGANETVMGKACFEQWLWDNCVSEVKHYHGDNGIFSAEEFRRDCTEKGQTQSFSGVGAQHQNARAERAIQTIMYMARTFMVHASLHWSDRGSDDLSLWSFAVKHSVWVYNRVPNVKSGLTPLELITRERSDYRDLLRCHVWGCPVYVLEAKLQNDQKLPKWNRRARLGQFVGFSDEHSSLVANVRHMTTNYISPQFHVVFDDLFETVNRTGVDDTVVESICQGLFQRERELYAEEELDDAGNIIYQPPPLHEVWLDEAGRRQGNEDRIRQRRRNEDLMRERNRAVKKVIPVPVSTGQDDDAAPEAQQISDDSSVDSSLYSRDSESEGGIWGNNDVDDASLPPEGGNTNVIPPEDDNRRAPLHGSPIGQGNEGVNVPRNIVPDQNTAPEGAKRRRGKAKQYPPAVWRRGADGKMERISLSQVRKDYKKLNRDMFALTFGHQDVPPMAQMMSKKRQRLNIKQYRQSIRRSGDMALMSLTLDKTIPTVADLLASPLAKYITLAANDCGYSGTAEELIVTYVHPLFLKAHSAASKADNPSWREATRGKFADEYWNAMKLEIATLENIDAWSVIDRESDHHVIASTWAFKCKRYPDGLIKKFKARFCARGDQQLEGIDFFETYAPVVQWTTIRLMFILEILLGLKSKQGDVTCAFLHADLEPGENVYVDMPLGFSQYSKNGIRKILKLKKTLYGLRQSPRAFWKYITEKLETCGLEQSKFDPCLFVGDKVICVVYVDDLICWSKDTLEINNAALQLRDLGVDLEQEDDAAGFLGVTLERDPETGLLEMKQTGLIKRIIEAVGLDDGSVKGKYTPSESKPLVKDVHGHAASGAFSYSSVVGMLLYLSGHTRPDITFAVNCCARYMFCPKHSHELALKRIGRYLKQTSDRGMVMSPSSDVCKIDAYPDADFAGMYGHEEHTDPACAKSRTGFIITFAECPVLWQSKLQTETALSTMEAEIIALSACCRELFPIIDMVSSVTKSVNLPIGKTTMNVSIHEDNSGALVLGKTLPPQFTPRSKYYAIKTIWFREEIFKRGIQLQKIDTIEQLGDIFTKGLTRVVFEYLRKKILGW